MYNHSSWANSRTFRLVLFYFSSRNKAYSPRFGSFFAKFQNLYYNRFVFNSGNCRSFDFIPEIQVNRSFRLKNRPHKRLECLQK